MKKWDTSDPDANDNIARRYSSERTITVRTIRDCGGCGAPATTLVNGFYPRCQSCANKVVSLWNEMRANKQGADS